ncbi:hypothetical protein CLOSTASPAR_00154 [[Clostridium] asparagiforme DSM 15981]|uniref:Uncharacterized protein n=1 Tax=[Clostridium] asparagiforme DSM 15981 TaxID=518636 RepID=C0CT55_9FIRM|nr:hypothetical protein CLOSTASPAR_00154 [[Clostridium] asparagiforme DSM 15981]
MIGLFHVLCVSFCAAMAKIPGAALNSRLIRRPGPTSRALL